MFQKMFVVAAFVAATSTFAVLTQSPSSAEDKPAKTQAAAADKTAASDAHAGVRPPDHLLATCIALGNLGEISVSEVARTKSQNDEVKKFAEIMIKDHHSFIEKLQKFAPEATKAGYLDDAVREVRSGDTKRRSEIQQTAAEENKDATDSAVKTADQKSAEKSLAGFNHMQLERELSAQCLASAKQQLDEKSGSEFDQCFVGHQLAMHGAMKDKLIVFQRHVSPELAAILAEGQRTTEEHLEKAEQLMKSLVPHSTTRTVETKRDGKVKERKVTREKE